MRTIICTDKTLIFFAQLQGAGLIYVCQFPQIIPNWCFRDQRTPTPTVVKGALKFIAHEYPWLLNRQPKKGFNPKASPNRMKWLKINHPATPPAH